MRFVFCTGPDIFSRAIRQVDGGDFSHCAVVLPAGDVVEATYKHGVRRRALASLLSDKPAHAVVDVVLPDEQAAASFALAQVGKPYDTAGMLGVGFGRDWQDSSAWWCTELALATAAAGGRRLAGNNRRIGVRLAYEVCCAWRG